MSIFDFFKNLFSSKEEEIDPKMKYLIVGLGNMHPDYDDTRHNVGFDVLDYLQSNTDQAWKHEKLGDISKVKHKGRTLILLKPSTYMNLSGKAVKYWMVKEKVPLENVLIVVDDLNLDFGRIRLRAKGSDGGHNGLKSIQQLLNTSSYPRLRIGIGDDFSKGRQVDYVLGKWSKKEQKQLPDIVQQSSKAIFSFSAIGLKRTMDQFNN